MDAFLKNYYLEGGISAGMSRDPNDHMLSVALVVIKMGEMAASAIRM